MTKFRRDPKFTPTSLTEHQLSRIEHLADAIVKRNTFCGFEKTWEDAEQLVSWWLNSCRRRQPSRSEAAIQSATAIQVRKFVDSDDTQRYLVGCILWVIACGLRSGELKRRPATPTSRARWYEIRNGY